jgi:hypothetical protein
MNGWLSGVIQGAPLLTALAALLALHAWKANILGARTVDLAEQCLTLCWKIEEEIEIARRPVREGFLLPRRYQNDTSENIERHATCYKFSDEKLYSILSITEEFSKTFRLMEFYSGRRFLPTKKMMKSFSFSLPKEIESIVGSLRVALWKAGAEIHPDPADAHDFFRYRGDWRDVFVGYSNDHGEDEFTTRIREARQFLERRLRPLLRRRSLLERYIDFSWDFFEDRYHAKKRKKKKAP